MAHKHAAIKWLRKSEKRAIWNRQVKDKIKTLRKQVLGAAGSKKADEAREAFRLFTKAVDKAAKRFIIKPNTAARLKSRLSARMRALARQ